MRPLGQCRPAERALIRARLGAATWGRSCNYAEGAYEVEFVTGGGKTLAVLTLETATLRLLAPSDMLHVREGGRA